ncbi:hypothetical protein RHMOL_Rhmol05G0087600 [Rhododendron molle]|uniref:Uncharacterized protein n=1 Tax=Rhododendron molle TaxID=49168 RepID=A0ACC0NMU3_RHOML|nr:hypothetical protein RHMOL_Rhmol05G0087600 [Rhododendron molle]
MRVLTNGEVVERSIDEYGGLPIQVPPPVHPTPVDLPNNSRFRRFRLPSEMEEGDDPRHSRLSVMDAWLADFKERTREDLPVNLMRGYRGVMSRNSFRKWPRTGSDPPLATVSPLEDQRLLPRLDYTLAIYDRRGKRQFVEPLLQYDASEDVYFKLDWNQSSFEGEAGDLLNWPNMFVKRNKLEAKCHKYLLRVPKARSAQMMAGRRPNRLHNDVCDRLQVEINAMSKRLIRQGLIVNKVREAERDGFDPRESIRGIKRDPQYASDPELCFVMGTTLSLFWSLQPANYLDQKEKLIKYIDLSTTSLFCFQWLVHFSGQYLRAQVLDEEVRLCKERENDVMAYGVVFLVFWLWNHSSGSGKFWNYRKFQNSSCPPTVVAHKIFNEIRQRLLSISNLPSGQHAGQLASIKVATRLARLPVHLLHILHLLLHVLNLLLHDLNLLSQIGVAILAAVLFCSAVCAVRFSKN